MNIKSKKKSISMVLVILLVCTLMLSSAFSGYISSGIGKGPVTAEANESVVKRENGKTDMSQLDEEKVKEMDSAIMDDDYVNYIIQMDSNATLLNLYDKRTDKNMSYQDFVVTRSARINSENIQKTHAALFKQISKQVDMKFMASYTTLVNAFSVSIKYKDRTELDRVAGKAGALSVSFSNTYDEPMYDLVSNTVDVWDTGIFKRPDTTLYPELEDYQGEGMFVAVIDTGLDYTHEAFSKDNLPKKNGVLDTDVLKIDYDRIKELIPLLSVTNGVDLNGQIRKLENPTVNDFYVNEKVPFAFDYGDFDTQVITTEEHMHGTHVSGIVLGKSNDPVLLDKNGNPVLDGEGKTQDKLDPAGRKVTGIDGVAPLAQLAAMKVFSEQRGGTEDAYLLPALEDCVTLGVDVINMSLGSTSGLTEHDNIVMTDAYKEIGKAGISLVVAAGNNHSSAAGGHYGLNLPTSPDSGVVSAPSSFPEAFSVASIQGVKAPYFRALPATGNTELGIAYYNESANPAAPYGYNSYNFANDLYKAIMKNPTEYGSYYTPDAGRTDAGTIRIPYVSVPGIGETNDYSSLTGVNSPKGKIVLIRRGTSSFVQKLTNARLYGAIAAITYNNISGSFGMSIDDTVGIPSCAITMSAAASFKDVKGGFIEFRVEKRTAEGLDEMKCSYGAGPFMSVFSSWGVRADLALKPEITGHGGEIYSAAPGAGNYARISGTSMASPNVAGLVTLARQYVKDKAEEFNIYADSKTISADKDGIDLNKLENRVYQLMMSTATLPRNEEGNAYSPRSIGAGLANITNLMRTDAFMYVADENGLEGMKDRTKLDLKDDKDKTGVFEKKRTRRVDGKNVTIGEDFEFFIRNTGEEALTYRLSSIVMTESLSIDERTVGEKPYIFEKGVHQNTEWKVNDVANTSGIVTVAAGQDAKISVKLTLLDDAKTYLEKFDNGMYVEGYICAEPVKNVSGVYQTDTDVPELSLPYLGFYGDWLAAPMFDESVYKVDKDAKDTTLKEDQKTYAQKEPLQMYGKYVEEGTQYAIPLGTAIFYASKSVEDRVAYATPERSALSLNQHAASELYFISGFLRSAKKIEWEIRNKTTGQLMDKGERRHARKNMGLTLEVSPLKMGCQVNVTYTFSFTAELDYPGAQREYCAMDFVIDGDAPIIANSQLRVERNNQNVYQRYLDLYLHDDNFLQTMDLKLYDKNRSDYYTLLGSIIPRYERGLYPLVSEKNSTTRVSFNLTNVWDKIEENDYQLSALIYDMSFNFSYYEMNLETMLSTTAKELSFGDIGIYTNYEKRDGSGSSTILTGYNETIAKDENGIDKKMTSITVRPNQSIKLNYALITTANVWPEDLTWSSDNSSAVGVDADTGEIFAYAAGTATITVKYGSGSSLISTTLTVKVLSQAEMDSYSKMYPIDGNAATLRGVIIDNYSKELRAGETYKIVAKPTPWFTNTSNLEVTWSSTDERVATVAPHPTEPFTAIVTAKKGTWGYYKTAADSTAGKLTPVTLNDQGQFIEAIKDSEGNFVENVIVESSKVLYFENHDSSSAIIVTMKTRGSTTEYVYAISVEVKKEFIIDGGTLTSYNGSDKFVYIPTNLNIIGIGRMAFANLHTVEHIVVPEKVERIEYGAFYFMKELQSVKLPSTIKFIGDWAFTAYYSVSTSLYTKLHVVDTEAFINPVYLRTRVFRNQGALGTDADLRNNGYYWPRNSNDPNVRIKFYGPEYTKFDTSKFRSIGAQAFYGCDMLTNLDLTGLRFAGQAAFRNVGMSAASLGRTYAELTAKKYLEVEFGKDTILSDGILWGAAVKEVELPMRRIPYGAFLECNYLEKVTFESDDLVIENMAFAGCFGDLVINDVLYAKEPASITFKGTVDYLGDRAFSHPNLPATEVKYIDFQKSVRHIGAEAFYGISLQSSELTMPAGLEYIGKDAFAGNLTLEKVIIPEGLTAPVDFGQAFSYCINFRTIQVTATDRSSNYYEVRTVNGRNSSDGVVQVSVLTYISRSEEDIAKIDEEMVLIPYGQSLYGFTVPKEITVLRRGAFGFNRNLTEIDFEEEEDVIREIRIAPYAMANMPRLKKATLPVGITDIPEGMFYGSGSSSSTGLEVINTEDVITVGANAFQSSGLVEITLDSCESIGQYAFSQSRLKTFEIPTGVTEIAGYVFYGISALEDVKFHDKITKIGRYAFAGIPGNASRADVSNKLTKILEADTKKITEIGDGAFSVCNNLTSAAFPAATKIGEYAFYARSGNGVLSQLGIPAAETIGVSAVENQKLLTNIQIEYAKTIGDYAFANTGITSTNIGERYIVSIGEGAFLNTGLTGRFTISTRVEYVGALAFNGTKITGFTVTSGNVGGYYTDESGVLFKKYENDVKELVMYPAGSLIENNYEIPEGVVRVAEYAFFNIQTLSFVSLPSTLKYIGDKAFFRSNISTYRFTSYQAPILEAVSASYDAADQNVYYWAVYANFYSYFSPSGNLSGSNFEMPYRYNTITGNYTGDAWKSTNAKNGANASVTGGGNNSNAAKYGLIMIRPGNGVGYTDFVYSNYFDTVFMGAETLEENTQRIIDIIKKLPDATTINNYAQAIRSKPAADEARREYERLTLGQRPHVANLNLLVALENVINQAIDSATYYDIVFKVEGTVSSTQRIAQGERITRPGTPSKANYNFAGWYFGDILVEFEASDEFFETVEKIDPLTGKAMIDPDTNEIIYEEKPVYVSKNPVSANMEITAKFTSNAFTVKFVGDEINLQPVSVNAGEAVAKPEDPQRKGYVFDGWYIGDTKYDFASPVNEDIILSARWTKSGCGCGTVNLFNGGGLLFGLLTITALLAITGILLLKRRNAKEETKK